MSRADAEKHIQRNPHPDFKKVEGSRTPWAKELEWDIKQTIKPDVRSCGEMLHPCYEIASESYIWSSSLQTHNAEANTEILI